MFAADRSSAYAGAAARAMPSTRGAAPALRANLIDVFMYTPMSRSGAPATPGEALGGALLLDGLLIRNCLANAGRDLKNDGMMMAGWRRACKFIARQLTRLRPHCCECDTFYLHSNSPDIPSIRPLKWQCYKGRTRSIRSLRIQGNGGVKDCDRAPM